MKITFLSLTISLLFIKLSASANPSENHFSPWGVDSEFANISEIRRAKNESISYQTPQNHKLSAGQKSCKAMIRFFQNFISPIDGPRSSFYPTSSQYALEAIQKYGVLMGIAIGCDRLMRENGEFWVYERTRDYGIERKLDPVR